MPRAVPHRPLLPRDGTDLVALEHLVARFDRRLRAVTRSYGLGAWDVDDVLQTTWLQYIEHGHELRKRVAVGAWLETTARRLSLRMLQRHMREQLTDDADRATAGDHAEPEREAVASERRETLHRALAGLPDRHRRLMWTLLLSPELSYEEVGRRLSVPVGSIGPMRARCLDRLRRSGPLRALQAEVSS